MRIKVLGTRGEVEPSLPRHSRHSGVLVDDRILLDLGEREYLEYRPESIFITHLHPDHAFFIVDEFPATDIPVYAPESYGDEGRVRPVPDEVTVGSCTVTPVPTHHSKKVRSTAYVITGEKHRLLYTGDVIWINKEHHPLLGNLDLVITDGSYIRKGGMIRKDRQTGQLYGHNGIPDLVNLFKGFARHILFVHFGSWFYQGAEEARRKLTGLGKEHGVTIHAGYDGMELDLDCLR